MTRPAPQIDDDDDDENLTYYSHRLALFGELREIIKTPPKNSHRNRVHDNRSKKEPRHTVQPVAEVSEQSPMTPDCPTTQRNAEKDVARRSFTIRSNKELIDCKIDVPRLQITMQHTCTAAPACGGPLLVRQTRRTGTLVRNRIATGQTTQRRNTLIVARNADTTKGTKGLDSQPRVSLFAGEALKRRVSHFQPRATMEEAPKQCSRPLLSTHPFLMDAPHSSGNQNHHRIFSFWRISVSHLHQNPIELLYVINARQSVF